MISLVFNSSGLTAPMLTLLSSYFQNFGASLESGARASEDTLASSPVIPVNSLAIAAVDAPIENVGATT